MKPKQQTQKWKSVQWADEKSTDSDITKDTDNEIEGEKNISNENNDETTINEKQDDKTNI